MNMPSASVRPLPFFSDYTNLAVFLLLLGLCSFVFTATRGLHSIEQIDLHNQASRHALQNTILIGETMSLLKDIETGQRGFLLTGDESFLAPYKQARQNFDKTYEKLTSRLLSDSRLDAAHQRLDLLVRQRIQHAEILIGERRTKGAAILQDPSLYVEGKHLMDEIRVEMGALQKSQMEASDTRIRQAADVQSRSLNLNFWLSIWGSLLLFVSALFLIREKRIRALAQQKLKNANAALENMVQERTRQLQSALQRIKRFASELDQSIETERRRLAREVHDQLGQVFTSLKMLILGLKNVPPDALAQKSEEVSHLLDEGINTARRISSELRPPLLDDFGLAAAIEHYAEAFSRRGGPKMTASIGQDNILSAAQANQLFRILQEAAANTLRHAQARSISVEGGQQDEHYRFSICDDGIGPQPIRKDASGVRNMRERAALAGGKFAFGAAEPRGTLVTITIPLQREEDQ